MQKLLNFLSTKNIGIVETFKFEILTQPLTNDVVSFE